jgi:carboxymethylenebutenolidase
MALKCDWIRYGDQIGYLAFPEGGGASLPGVVVIAEIMGVNDNIEDITRRIAQAGYAALAPDFFAVDGERPENLSRPRVDEALVFMRSLPPASRFDPAAREEALRLLPEDERARLLDSLGAIYSMPAKAASLVEPLRKAVRYLAHDRAETRGARVGCVGFCMGGGLSALLACEEEVSGAAVFYGNTPPPERLATIACPVIGFYGEADARVNAGIPAFAEAMAKAGQPWDCHIYKGASHAFFNDTGPSYAVDASRDAFIRLLAFFQARLAGPTPEA